MPTMTRVSAAISAGKAGSTGSAAATPAAPPAAAAAWAAWSMSASAISSADWPGNWACSAAWSRTRSRGAIATTCPASHPVPEPARCRTARVPRPATRAPEAAVLPKALASLRRSCGRSVSLISAATSAARSEMSVVPVSGSAMAYPYPSSPVTHISVPPRPSWTGLVRPDLIRTVRRVPEVRCRPRGGGAQHRGLPRQQRALEAQPLQGIRLGQQRLAFRQVDDHGGGDDEGEQRRLVGQVLEAYHGAAPFGQRVQVLAEGGLDHPHGGLGRRRAGRLPGEDLDLALQVRPGLVEPEQPEPLRADGDDVEPSVVVPLDPAQGGGAADPVERVHAVDAGLASLADRDHAEPARLGPVEQVADELPVPLLEDVQRQQHAGVEHRAEREQRQHLAHNTILRDGPRVQNVRTIFPRIWPLASRR